MENSSGSIHTTGTRHAWTGAGRQVVIVMTLLLLPFAAACDRAQDPAARAQESPEVAPEPAGAHQEPTTELARLRGLAGSEGDDEEAAWEYLDSLEEQRRLEVARLAAGDTEDRLNAIGINALVQSGHEDEAVPALSARVAAGDDLTAFGYAWVHGDDPHQAVRMYLKICRYQLARLDSFDGEARANVERFLSDGGYVDPLPEFSQQAAEERLARIEATLPDSTP